MNTKKLGMLALMIVLTIGIVLISGYVQEPDIPPPEAPAEADEPSAGVITLPEALPEEDISPAPEVEAVPAPEVEAMPPEEAITIKLISPKDGEEIDTTTPRFEWMLIDLPEVSYNLTIWQLTEDLAERVAEGYMLNEEGLADIEPYFVKDGIEETFFVYTEDVDNPLLPGYYYSWQIKTLDITECSKVAVFYFTPSIIPVIMVTGGLGMYKIKKEVNTEQANVGDILTFTLRIESKSGIKIPKLIIEDLLPKETKFIKGSVSVSEQPIKGGKKTSLKKQDYKVDTGTGKGKLKIEIEKAIPKGKVFLITFKVEITSYPKSGIIKNEGITLKIPKFTYKKATIGPYNFKFKKGTETTVSPRYTIKKVAKPTEVGPGDYITYTITIENKEDKEIEVTLYELIPDNTRYVGPLKVDGKIIKPETYKDKDIKNYHKFKVKIPAKKKITITLRYKVTEFGEIKNYIYSSEPPKGRVDSTIVKSTEKIYINNTYQRELLNIIRHKKTANSVHNIDETLNLIKKGKKKYTHTCPDGTKIEINISFAWGKKPSICQGEDIKGETLIKISKNVVLGKKTVIKFDVLFKIEYECIFKYDKWRQNKALFYHEMLHIQLQLDNWNNEDWWKEYCQKWNRKFSIWFKEKKLDREKGEWIPPIPDPPPIIQSGDKDHKKIGKNHTEGWHKEFLDKLKKIKD